MKFLITIGTIALGLSITSSAAAFSDVTTGDPFAEAIYYLEDKGMIKGYDDGSYRPNALLNRAEFLKIVFLATQRLSEKEFEEARVCRHRLPYPDVSISDWYHVYLCTADSQGIIDGYPDGTFKPEQSINFVEASKIIVKSFNRERRYLSIPLTNDTPWYKKYIVFLDRERAIPWQIRSLDQALTRGQMAEIIYRIYSGYTSERSRTYFDFTLEEISKAEYNRPEIYSFNVQPSGSSIAFYFFPQTGEAAFVNNNGDTMNTFDASYASEVLQEHKEGIANKEVSTDEFIIIQDIDDDGISEFLLQESEDPATYTVWKYEINKYTNKPWMYPLQYGYSL